MNSLTREGEERDRGLARPFSATMPLCLSERGAIWIVYPVGIGRESRGREEVLISNKVFVGNMNYNTTQSEIESLFSEVGEVIEVSIPIDRNTGRPRGFAFVAFADEAAAAQAVEKFDGYMFQSRSIRVNEAEERQPYSPGFFHTGSYGSPGKQRKSKPKGSRRNIRARKRGF